MSGLIWMGSPWESRREGECAQPHKAQAIGKHKGGLLRRRKGGPSPARDRFHLPTRSAREKNFPHPFDLRDKRANGCYALMQTGYAFSTPAARALGGMPPSRFARSGIGNKKIALKAEPWLCFSFLSGHLLGQMVPSARGHVQTCDLLHLTVNNLSGKAKSAG
jgi:hypothetical protein